MIILSNSLTAKTDEGCLKAAGSLIRRIKQRAPETTVISYGQERECADQHLRVNKLLLNLTLIRTILGRKEPVLYVPFPARALPTMLRIWILSRYARHGLRVILAQYYPVGRLAGLLLRSSGAEVIALSCQSWEFYRTLVGDRAHYLKAGVDTQRFTPVSKEQKQLLRQKYSVAPEAKVVLHVGHLTEGRNIRTMINLDERFHIYLVVSTLTKDAWDERLRADLEARPNTTILDEYLPDIEEIYQLADAYFFPVEEVGHCIDVPLSAMEAAACGLPVVATPYGELRALMQREGFWQIESFAPEGLNAQLERAIAQGRNGRESVLVYDWSAAVDRLLRTAEVSSYSK